MFFSALRDIKTIQSYSAENVVKNINTQMKCLDFHSPYIIIEFHMKK